MTITQIAERTARRTSEADCQHHSDHNDDNDGHRGPQIAPVGRHSVRQRIVAAQLGTIHIHRLPEIRRLHLSARQRRAAGLSGIEVLGTSHCIHLYVIVGSQGTPRGEIRRTRG